MQEEKKEPADSSETNNVQDKKDESLDTGSKLFFAMVYLLPYLLAWFFTMAATREVLGGHGSFFAGSAVFWILWVLGRPHRDTKKF